MHIPSRYHKSMRQRHHELHPKVFYYDDQNVPSRTVALYQLLQSYIRLEVKIKMKIEAKWLLFIEKFLQVENNGYLV